MLVIVVVASRSPSENLSGLLGVSRACVRVPPSLATDDLTLVKRVRSGDQRAFKLLVERYQRKVYAVALGMLKDKEEAMDVSQEAFVKVYKYLDHFKGDASLLHVALPHHVQHLHRRASASARGRAARRWSSTRRMHMDVCEANIGALGSRLGTNPQKSALRQRAGREDPGGPASRCPRSTAPSSCCARSRACPTRTCPARSTFPRAR